MNCLDNLERCKASCCRGFRFHGGEPTVSDGVAIFFREPLTDDEEYYYQLHGVGTTTDAVLIPLGSLRREGDDYLVDARCEALGDDFLCKLHPDKPKVCSGYTEADASDGAPTEGCYFNPS